MTKVYDTDLQVAIAWLEVNEGEADEKDACQRVADFLKLQLENREVSAIKRKLQKEGTKVSSTRIKAALRRQRQ